jgi:hypothetical protein
VPHLHSLLLGWQHGASQLLDLLLRLLRGLRHPGLRRHNLDRVGGWGWRGGRQQLLEGGRHSEQLVGRESVVRGIGQWDFPDFHKPGEGLLALGSTCFLRARPYE